MANSNVIKYNVTTDFEKERINKRLEAYAQATADSARKDSEEKN